MAERDADLTHLKRRSGVVSVERSQPAALDLDVELDLAVGSKRSRELATARPMGWWRCSDEHRGEGVESSGMRGCQRSDLLRAKVAGVCEKRGEIGKRRWDVGQVAGTNEENTVG
jgi:hypothetical protein